MAAAASGVAGPGTESAETSAEVQPSSPSIARALGQLLLAALLAAWPIFALMTAAEGDCERDGLALVCESGRVETTINLGIVGLLALFALAAFISGIIMLVLALRRPPT